MTCLERVETPQLKRLHRGKVRDSFRVDEKTRLMIATDRLSAFDKVLASPIPRKGEVLNRLSGWWFEKCRDLADHHYVRTVGPGAALVREAQPIKIEMIVRGYLTGSMWRGYQKGEREFSGQPAPDGLKQNQKFPQPIVTPTTKEKSDRPITPRAIVEEGWATAEQYATMEKLSLALFERGSRMLAERGILLVDTKYEFGVIDGKIVLIDEIHTPDASRFWDAAAWRDDPLKVESMDKEYVRKWLLEHPKAFEAEQVVLPDEVVGETSRRYVEIFHRITGENLPDTDEPAPQRLYRALVREGLMTEGYVAVVMGSTGDRAFCDSIRETVERYGIFCDLRVLSAHKNGERIAEEAETYNHSLEPGVVIAVAGRSNGLGGALGANLAVPVISAPPLKDMADYLVNINSSLVMPSRVPCTTVLGADNAALAALRALNVPRLKAAFREDIAGMKRDLLEADTKARGGA